MKYKGKGICMGFVYLLMFVVAYLTLKNTGFASMDPNPRVIFFVLFNICIYGLLLTIMCSSIDEPTKEFKIYGSLSVLIVAIFIGFTGFDMKIVIEDSWRQILYWVLVSVIILMTYFCDPFFSITHKGKQKK